MDYLLQGKQLINSNKQTIIFRDGRYFLYYKGSRFTLSDEAFEDLYGLEDFFVKEEDETVIISRKKEGIMNYAVAVVFLALFSFLLFSLVALTRRRQRIFKTLYYKNRISTVLMVS
ncbi:MAG: hypothetical protein IKE33_00990, partial [Erysipelotrichaceae bacterium]|nr:hypothetical protein [Erysipelotrichaceae bacterium]